MTLLIEKDDELLKCCKKFPHYHKVGELYWVQCQDCDNKSPVIFMRKPKPARKKSGLDWNEMRERQLKVESLYTGKAYWYKKKNERNKTQEAT